ncbi:MAG: alpha/beta hydrolase family protein [Gammaproteobacteria bacterium]
MNICTFQKHAWHWLPLALLLIPIAALAQTAAGVGFKTITIHDPVNGGSMPGYVFYPSAQAKGVTWRGPYELDASAGTLPVPGAKPLVVISHGQGGSDLGHHDLATYLASHGFIVATLEHPKDNFHDSSGVGHLTVLAGRAIQVSATINMLLHDPYWRNLISADRIGVAGFSMGGYTSLLLVGAVPHFDRLIAYCKRHPGDTGTCDLITRLAAQSGKTEMDYLDGLQKNFTRWGNTDDPRVKAAFVMAPMSMVFDQAGLAHINRPVYLYYGQDDPVLLPQYNVLHIAPLIKTLAGIKMIPKAGHYVFLSPCSPQLAKEAPDICTDPPGVNRVAEHRQIDADALAFFRSTLDVQ